MTRSIGKADVEFYYSSLVIKVANRLTTKPWDQLSHNSKQRLLDKSIDIIHDLLNDSYVQDKLRIFLATTSKPLDF